MMKNLILIAAWICCSSWAVAQDMDPNKMNRDLKIAEDVIRSLFKSQSEEGHFYSVRPKATYVPDFGVMISINGNNHFYSRNMGKSVNFTWDDGSMPIVIDVEELEDIEIQAEQLALEAEELAKMYSKQGKLNEEQQREMEKQARKMEVEAHKMEQKARKYEEMVIEDEQEKVRREVVVINSDKSREEMKEEIKTVYKSAMITFFTDYADLIGQLDDKEKIMLTSELGGSGYGAVFMDGDKSKLSATVLRKDLSTYKMGKLSKDKFITTIDFKEDAGTKKSPDLELLSSIFQRLYKSDLATTFYCHEAIPYERLENFGVIYKMKVYSSTSYGKDQHKITTLGKSGLTQVERDEIVNGMYPQFEKELKENILDYAKTIKSLEEDEAVIFQVNLTQCNGCEMPKQIDVSVRQSVLKGYDSGKMKRGDALSKISVKEGR